HGDLPPRLVSATGRFAARVRTGNPCMLAGAVSCDGHADRARSTGGRADPWGRRNRQPSERDGIREPRGDRLTAAHAGPELPLCSVIAQTAVEARVAGGRRDPRRVRYHSTAWRDEDIDRDGHALYAAGPVARGQDHAARRWRRDPAGTFLVRAAVATARTGLGPGAGLRAATLAGARLLPERLRLLLRRLVLRLLDRHRLGLHDGHGLRDLRLRLGCRRLQP